MVRKAREKYIQAYYHVYSRGVRKLPIFIEERDFLKVFFVFDDAFKKYSFELCDFAIMNNHYHFLIHTFNDRDEISRLMQYVNSRIAKYFNYNNGFSGHVFEEVFCSGVVHDRPSLLRLIRYIERNPVKAVMVKECQNWEWTLSNFLVTQKYSFDFINQNLALSFFQNSKTPLKDFLDFINYYDPEDDLFDPVNMYNFLKQKIDNLFKEDVFESADELIASKIFLYRELLGLNLKEIATHVNKSYDATRKTYIRIFHGESPYSKIISVRLNKVRKQLNYLSK
jgi:REP element-mobilizing transposase RayT